MSVRTLKGQGEVTTEGRPAGPRVLPVVYVERPRCPSCDSTDIQIRSTLPQGDGSLLRYCRCRACGKSLKVVLE